MFPSAKRCTHVSHHTHVHAPLYLQKGKMGGGEGHGGSRKRRGGRTLACRGSSGKAWIFPPSGRPAVFTLHFPVKLSRATALGAGARVAFFAGEPGSRPLTHGCPGCRRAPPAPLGPSWQVKGASAPASPGIWLQSERPPSAPGALRRLLRAAALAPPAHSIRGSLRGSLFRKREVLAVTPFSPSPLPCSGRLLPPRPAPLGPTRAWDLRA